MLHLLNNIFFKYIPRHVNQASVHHWFTNLVNALIRLRRNTPLYGSKDTFYKVLMGAISLIYLREGGKTTSNIFLPIHPENPHLSQNQSKHFSLEQRTWLKILSIPFLKGNNNPVITKQAVPLIWYHCKSKSFIWYLIALF